MAVHTPTISTQLELELEDARVNIPWGGQSPRALTKCGKLFSLKALGASRSILDANQYTLFLKGNPSYGS